MSKTNNNAREVFKKIPSVDQIIKNYQLEIPKDYFKYCVNLVLDEVRFDIHNGKEIDDIKLYVNDKINQKINHISNNSLKEVINATGIILHTGLGRAPISEEILIQSIKNTYPYTNLEFNLENGKRGERNSHISDLFNSLCNVDSSLIVNNNAAAVMLMLNSICEGKEVIISRGQQVEIGGSFRIPDVIKKSNCKMIEVGTTNKTHLNDYESEINENTAAILYVHTSNYKVIGFTNEIEISDLSKLATKYNIPLLVDLGSGSLADYKSFGLPMEKLVKEYVKKGANIISFSGDKLLGGPQAGIIVGDNKLVKLIKNNPIYRSVRCDKVRISIMEGILRTYYSERKISKHNLSIQLFIRTIDEIKENISFIISKLSKNHIDQFNIKSINTYVEAGSGSLPTEKIPSLSLVFKHQDITASQLYKRFLHCDTPVVGYINNNVYHIDFKAIPNNQNQKLIKSIKQALK
tara:strand:- start:4603 stop:5994 length:1392 start_codon:yes stop_codon:yes gene_type:complete